MVTQRENKTKKKTQGIIEKPKGQPAFSSLPAEQQQKIRDLANPSKTKEEIRGTVPSKIVTPRKIEQKPKITSKIKSGAAKTLDVISSPLSQPSETIRGITEGDFGRGARAVSESRERIRGGDIGEAANTIITTIASTTLAVGALLTATGGITAALAVKAGESVAGGVATAGIGLSIIYGVDKLAYAPGELAVWAAVDNVAGALGFQSREITQAVREGTMELTQAETQFEQMLKDVSDMRTLVRRETQKNPKLYASSKVLLEAIDTAEESINVQREEARTTQQVQEIREEKRLKEQEEFDTNLLERQLETEGRSKEEFERRQGEIEQSQQKRSDEIRQAQIERDAEIKESQRLRDEKFEDKF